MFKLVREETTAADAAIARNQWAVKFTATYTADDTPAKIFVMHQGADDNIVGDTLSCIASAIQMGDLPEDAPLSGSPYYRVANVTKLCRSAAAAEEFVEKVYVAVQELANNLQAAETLSVVEEVTITPNNA